MRLYQLIYQSQSLVPFELDGLENLLRRSRSYNRQHCITGVLLYTPDGRFFQVLEGTEAAVRHLYHQRIVPDPRHHNCHVFSEGPCLNRSFSNRAMCFRPAHAPDLRLLLGCVPSDIPALLMPRPHTRPELMQLLLDFVHGHSLAAVPEQQAAR